MFLNYSAVGDIGNTLHDCVSIALKIGRKRVTHGSLGRGIYNAGTRKHMPFILLPVYKKKY